jgi:hypothetical protein
MPVGAALDLEALDHGDGVAIGEHVADGVLDHVVVGVLRCCRFPFVGALRADE